VPLQPQQVVREELHRGASGGAASGLYDGRPTDADGLIYMRARYYDPVSGRFLSEDPVATPGGGSRYTFAGGDPLNWVDPMGTMRAPDFMAGCGKECDFSPLDAPPAPDHADPEPATAQPRFSERYHNQPCLGMQQCAQIAEQMSRHYATQCFPHSGGNGDHDLAYCPGMLESPEAHLGAAIGGVADTIAGRLPDCAAGALTVSELGGGIILPFMGPAAPWFAAAGCAVGLMGLAEGGTPEPIVPQQHLNHGRDGL
jgi:RHS repeat-associated protein